MSGPLAAPPKPPNRFSVRPESRTSTTASVGSTSTAGLTSAPLAKPCAVWVATVVSAAFSAAFRRSATERPTVFLKVDAPAKAAASEISCITLRVEVVIV